MIAVVIEIGGRLEAAVIVVAVVVLTRPIVRMIEDTVWRRGRSEIEPLADAPPKGTLLAWRPLGLVEPEDDSA